MIIRDIGVWAIPTPPELKLTFQVDMSQGQQGEVWLLFPFIPTVSGLWKHTLTRGSGQQRQARVQAEGETQDLSAPQGFTFLPHPNPEIPGSELMTSLHWYSPSGAENSAQVLDSHPCQSH